ncbi:MAG: hypothetical protein U0793_04395 [Gemmataceae bacterium]
MLRLLISATLMLVTITSLAAPTGRAQDKSPAGIKWDTKGFENAIQTQLGLKMKSISLLPRESKGGFSERERVKILLEFAKDAEYDLAKINDSFDGLCTVIHYAMDRDSIGFAKLGSGRLELLYYDEENVRIGRMSRGNVEGEITGKEGETFRVWVRAESGGVAPNVRRIEVRLHPRLNIQRDKQSMEITKAIKWETGEFRKALESDYGLKLKSVAVVSIGKERHIVLECERTKLEKEVKGRLFNLAGFFDRPFLKASGGIECQFFGPEESVLATITATTGAAACCTDDHGRFGSGGVGDPVTIFVRSPGDPVLTKARKAALRIAAPEKEKEK